MAIIKYKDKNGNLQPLGATGDHSHSLESLGAAAKDHPHDVATAEKDGFMSKGDKAALDEAGKDIEKLETLLGNDQTPVSEKIAQAVEAEATRALEEEKGLDERLSTIEGDYLIKQDKTSLEQQIAAAEESAVDRVLGYAEGDTVSIDFDTLKKVATWIASDIDESEKLTGRVSAIEGDHLTSKDKDELNGKIAKNSGDITTLNGQVASKVAQSDFDTWTAKMPSSGTVAELVNSTVEGLNIKQYATNQDLDSAEARIAKLEALPQGDATTSASGFMSSGDKQKLEGIDSGANKYVHAIHISAESGLYKVTVDGEGHVSGTSKVEKSDITGLGIPSQDTTYKTATDTTEGLMSANDKKALDTLSSWVTGSVSEAISQAIQGHGHNYAKSDSDGGAADAAKKVSNSLIVQLNGGTADDTNKFTFNGSAAKTINITPSSIGAAANSSFKGTTNTTPTAGLVPAPTKGDTAKFLCNNGTWATPPDTNTTYSAGTGISLNGTVFSNSGVRSVSEGSTKGTISVNIGGTSTDVSVKGLGSAAYTDSGKYESSGAAAEALAAANKYTDDAIDDITPSSIGAAASSHGNHVPTTETANNAKFLRNDNTWQTVTPGNIGALTATTISRGNFNDIKNPGIYALYATSQNAPTDTGYWTLIVGTSSNQTGNYVHQIAICECTCDMYIRYKAESTWCDWRSINPGSASTSKAGIVQLLDSISSTSTSKAATPNSVKTAYDLANSKSAVKLNGSSTASGTASFYAPTSAGTSGQILKSNGSGAPSWADAPSTMTGATSTTNGKSGLVPTPAAGANELFLCGNGSWATVTTGIPYASADTKGCIKVGTGLSISDGVLSATGGGVSSASPTFTGSLSLNRNGTVADYSSTLGFLNTASAQCAHAEGNATEASAFGAHAEGFESTASGTYSHAEGRGTTASNQSSHAEGEETLASGLYSHAEGYGTVASGAYSHTEGYGTVANSTYCHAEGSGTVAKGYCAHSEGCQTAAGKYQHAQGTYNNQTTATAPEGIGASAATAFVIGNGTSTANSNAFRVTYQGNTYGAGSTINQGADYAEYFEWQDSNPGTEDRRGYFVTLDGEQIKIAEPNDYILGIISGQPAVIGNGDEDWRGRYILDEFGAFITEEFEYEEEIHETVIDEETGEARVETKTVTKTGTKYKENPDYDSSLPYVQRADRPEWDAVGMMGVLSVRDDGTCQVNGYCKVAEGGIATASESGYRVIKRINDHIVKVVFR